ATGLSADVFYSGFISWAGAQVRAWGLGPTPDDEQLADLKKATGAERVALLRELIDKYPDHPPLRRLDAARRIESGDYDTARAAILRYAEVRPIDPWANRALLKLARTHQRVEDMVGPLEELDRAMQKHGRLAAELAEIYRGLDRPDQAAEAYRRALHREPFAAAWREKAAAVELERGERAAALRHVQAMTLIEPERVIQWIRLAAMHQKLGQPEKAAEAARQALRLDPLAPVEQYLQ
ncbi:MAG: hypothetical protein CMJ18_16005, partial [Phycisphaeraceae bacterium]|nr:hypothetical protein [Phycisphaeraceae bacterium]